MKKRIEWIDAAKGFAICSTVVSHTAPLGTFTRNFFFSFHMPLFFILSGFTTHPPENLKALIKKTKKDAKSLLIPVLVFAFINYLYYFLISGNLTAENLVIFAKKYLLSIFWSSGATIYDKPALGMLWFLISIFTARLIFNVLHIIFKNDKAKIIPILLGFIGIHLGKGRYFLPFNFDVSLVALLFITIGYLAKIHYDTIRKYYLPLLLASLVVWVQVLMNGEYIELATRFFGYSVFPIVGAVCGTFVICAAIKAICDAKILKEPLVFFGSGSLVVLCVHSMDGMLVDIWSFDSVKLSCAVRLAIVLAASSMYLLPKKFIKKRKANTDRAVLRTLASIKLSDL